MQISIPRTLLPRVSSRGEYVAMPICRLTTAMTPPLTPLLAGHADAIRPLARVVVHPAREHDGEHVLHGDDRTRAAGERIASHVRQGRRHGREIAAGDENRALPEVDVERHFGLVVDHAEVQEQVRDRAVAVAGAAFGLVDGLVHLQPPARGRAQAVEDLLEGLRRRRGSGGAPSR